MAQELQDTREKVAKACTVKESLGAIIGVLVLWQFRQTLKSFDTGCLIQGRPIWKLLTKNTVHMKKCCLQNLKMSKTCCEVTQSCPTLCLHQAPLSMGFSRQGYWSGLPFPSPENLPDPGIKPRSPTLYTNALPSEPPGKSW